MGATSCPPAIARPRRGGEGAAVDLSPHTQMRAVLNLCTFPAQVDEGEEGRASGGGDRCSRSVELRDGPRRGVPAEATSNVK